MVPGRLTNALDYKLPHPLASLVDCGMRVWVPLKNKKVCGWIVEITENTDCDDNKLRYVDTLIDREVMLSPSLHRFLVWVASYYLANLYDVISLAMPAPLIKGQPLSNITISYYRPTEFLHGTSRSMLPNHATKQLKMLDFSHAHPKGFTYNQAVKNGFKASDLARFVKSGWLDKSFIYPEAPISTKGQQCQPPDLNDEQKRALSYLDDKIDQFEVTLLYGVTGSGKTRVYLNLIQRMIEADRQCLVLVPEINLTPHMVAQFRTYLQDSVEVFHSGLTDKKRLERWYWAKHGQLKVIIATRLGIFLPLAKPGIIIIDEEHDASFKQQQGIRYHARNGAIMRAKMLNIPVVMGTATPSLETLWNVKCRKYHVYYLFQRTKESQLPSWHLIRSTFTRAHSPLAPQMIEKVKMHLNAQKQAMIFINRRGYAPVLMCQTCSWICQCPHCEKPYTLHQHPQMLICHHCGRSCDIMIQCPECQSQQLKPVGEGTEKIESFLQSVFPDANILRFDQSINQGKGGLEKALTAIDQKHIDIIVGTQMVSKGHHFPYLTFVGVINIDSAFHSGDFRAVERMGQQLTQVTGRAGRENTQGEVMIQTAYPKQPLLNTLLKQGYLHFAEKLIEERQMLDLPPITHMALLRVESTNRAKSHYLVEEVKMYVINVFGFEVSHAIFGPMPALQQKLKDYYRHILVINTPKRHFRTRIMKAIAHYVTTYYQGRIRYTFDVDPVEMN